MTDSGPFIDFSKITDDEIIDRLNKISARIVYYYNTNYSYLVPQLQEWEDMYREELRARAEKRAADKNKLKNNSNVIFDNSDEVIDAEKVAKELKDKDKQ